MIELDVRTGFATCAVGYAAMGAMMTHVLFRRRTYPGYAQWTLSAWLGALGAALVALRGLLPDLLSMLAANLILLGVVVLVLEGMDRYLGQRRRRGALLALFLGFGCALAAFQYLWPSLRMRVVVIAFSTAWLGFLCAGRIRKHMAGVVADPYPMILWAMVLFSLVNLVRGLLAVLAPPPSEDFMHASQAQGLVVLAFLFTLIVVYTSLLVLNTQRVEQDLRLALEECRVLREFIPICAQCKKIRNDHGGWDSLEAYLHQRTGAQLSHGLCPDCARELRAQIPDAVRAQRDG